MQATSPELMVLAILATNRLAASIKRTRGSARTHLGLQIDRTRDGDDEQLDGADGGAAVHKGDALNT
jgi:hypothetical protein